jgi:hypothetical protein
LISRTPALIVGALGHKPVNEEGPAMQRWTIVAALALIVPLATSDALAAQSQSQLTFRGTTSFSSLATGGSETGGLGPEFHIGPEFDARFERIAKGSISPSRVPAAHVPTPADSVITGFRAGAGFDGLTHRDQRLAAGGNQFSTEPPDQGLAVGNGYVLEAVNTAVRVRRTDGSTASGTVSLNQFFGLPVAIDRTTGRFGPFTTDPKAYFDIDTQRWFVTMLEIDQHPVTGDFLPHSEVMIAVSQTANPTGTWNIFSIDVTNVTGTPEHTNCPCFGDQPLIGADAHGFYVSTNEFPLFVSGFNGAQIYAMSKAKLAAGMTPTVVAFSGLPLAESQAYTVQPAITAQGGTHASLNNGTEYFLSALEFTNTLDNRIAVWALSNTRSLDDAVPSLTLRSRVIDSQVYGFPPDVRQKPGPAPLGEALSAAKGGAQPLPLIAANDDRMQQVTWADGKLWSSLNTVVKPQNGTVQSGAAYFVVAPSWSGSSLGGSVVKQGYVSVSGLGIVYPSVGVNKNGKGVMSFSIAGTSMYPSVGYVPIDATQGAGPITLVAQGAGPDDGFSGYAAFGGDRAGRWGDYSAAVADVNGTIWFANEYIPNAPRTVNANWGTFIGKVSP